MPCKITLIGAGSVIFAKTLVGDILQFPELSDATICLMDIDPSRLKVADILMRKTVAKLGVKAKIEATSSQRQAIKGAKYVICTVQVGGYKPSTVADFEIPTKYGLRQTIADTLGVGGVFRGLRTIPVINSIARDIADVGHSDCLFLNYSNPMAMNCWAVDRAVGIPHVGLCHSVFGTARMLAGYANLPYEDISYLVAGVNHMAFFLKFQYKGQDAYPLLFKALNDPTRKTELVRFEMMRRLGYFVTESSEHQAEYTPHFIHHGKKTINQFDIPIDEYLRRCDAIIGEWQATEAQLLGGKKGQIDVPPQSHEYGSYIIHSRETNTPRTVYGNVPNRHIIDNLRQGCNVEVPCQVDGTGLHPLRIGNLPPQLEAICSTQINVQNLTVEAALTGQREHIYHAVMTDPHTAATLPLDKIWAMCDELIEAHQADGYLGEFSDTLPNSGRRFTGIGDRCIVTLRPKGEFFTDKGSQSTLTLTIENPSHKALKLPITFSASDPNVSILGKARRQFTVPAGETVQATLETRNSTDIHGSCTIQMQSSAANVLLIDWTLQAREIHSPDNTGSIPISIQLNGFDALDGTMQLTNEAIELDFHIRDSAINPKLKSPWEGSVIECFFGQNAESAITQLFLIPQPKKKNLQVLTVNRKLKSPHKLAKSVKTSLQSTNLDYRCTATLPLSLLNLDPNQDSFIFDFIVRVGALGDAHSGGSAAFGGHFNSADTNVHYAMWKTAK